MMKVLRSIFLVCALFIFVVSNLKSTSLIGTSNIVYEDSLYTFTNGDEARGAVYLNGGFSVPRGCGVRLSISVPVRKLMSLNTTGSVILEDNLILDPGVTLDSSGVINGGGNTLILSDDLTIPALTALKITSTLVIDGNGNTLFIDNFGQLLVDSHSTLTLRNLIIKNYFNSSTYPAIALKSSSSKLALENVKMALNNDLWINNGSIFFHGNVRYSGDTSLVYHSQQASFIAPDSTLYFDKGTKLFYFPQDTQNNLLQMQSDTSDLFFDGCSVETTPTGVYLSRGRVFFNNQVTLDSGLDYINSIDTLQNISYGSNVKSIAWSPDGTYIAMGGENKSSYVPGQNIYLRIYQFDPANSAPFTQVASVYYANASTGMINSVCWSPDGNYIAVGGYGPQSSEIFTSQNLRIYQFIRASNTLQPICGAFYGTTINSIDWSSSGKFIVAGGSGATATDGFSDTYNVKVYLVDFVKATLIANSSYRFTDYDAYSVHWRSFEDYLAVGGLPDIHNLNSTHICSFSPYQAIVSNRLKQVYRLTAVNDAYSVKWSHDGEYLALGGFNNSHTNPSTGQYEQIQLYAFDPSITSSLTYLSGYPLFSWTYDRVFSIDWLSDDSSILIGSQSTPTNVPVETIRSIFDINPENLSLILDKTNTRYGIYEQASTVAWHPSGLYFVEGTRTGKYSPETLTGGYLLLQRFKGKTKKFVDSRFYTNPSTTSGGIYSVAWSGDGRYLAIGGTGAASGDDFNNSDELRIYEFDYTSERLYPITSTPTGAKVVAVSWKPDGKYLAVGYQPGGAVSDKMDIYSFNGENLNFIARQDLVYSNVLSQISWHPCGTLIGVGLNTLFSGGSVGFWMFTFDGVSITGPFTGIADPSACFANGFDWSKSGKYLAITYNGGDTFLDIYAVNYNTATPSLSLVTSLDFVPDKTPISVVWGLDDKYVLFFELDEGHYYSFDGSSLTELFLCATYNAAALSPEGTGLASILAIPLASYLENFYFNSIINQSNYSLQLGVTMKGNPQCIAWQPNGQHLAIGLIDAFVNAPDLYVAKVNKFVNFLQSAPRGLDMDSSLQVNVLGGSQVNVNGVANYVS